LVRPSPAGARILPAVTSRARADSAAMAFVRSAVADALPGYRRCFVAGPRLPSWIAPRRIHGSTGARTWILVRRDRDLPCPPPDPAP
jgi:hypothetical protein